MSSLKPGRSNRPGLSALNFCKVQLSLEQAIESAIKQELGGTYIVYASAAERVDQLAWQVTILVNEVFYSLTLDRSLED